MIIEDKPKIFACQSAVEAGIEHGVLIKIDGKTYFHGHEVITTNPL